MTLLRVKPVLVNPSRIRVLPPLDPGFDNILSEDSLRFIADLVGQFSERLESLLKRRSWVAGQIRKGAFPDFPPETDYVRKRSWKIGRIPQDLQKRRVEITGPVDRKMMINALNSGADIYMADFEDSHSPTWNGTVQGQVNLKDAVRGKLDYTSPDGKQYGLNEKLATLCVRPRGLHLSEKHVLVNKKPCPAPLFDFGLYVYHNAETLVRKGTGPYFYLPKLENHLEAKLWKDIFQFSEGLLGLPAGSIKCTVLVENILAAFEMDEILYELRDHITGLNFGRWDYIFSFIKKLGWSPKFLFPDRAQLTMSAHFLRSASLLLVDTCHKRGAYAIGGMAAQIPIKNNPDAMASALEKVIADKKREVEEGYDGAWVAHPGLVPVVMKIFSENMSGPNQLHVMHENHGITSEDLLSVPLGLVTEEGLQAGISVSLRYLESWLQGSGCVAINNLMEDTATVEINRALIWQWIRHGAEFSDGRKITVELFQALLEHELAKIGNGTGPETEKNGALRIAGETLHRLVSETGFVDFLTNACYDYLDSTSWN